MLAWFIILGLELALLAAIALARDPRLLVPAVIGLLPVEIVESLAGDATTGSSASFIGALLNPGQVLMIVTVVVAILRQRHDPGRLIPNSSMVVPILALFTLMLLGVAWSDSLVPANSVLVLPLYVAFAFVAPSLIEDRRDVERIVVAFLAVAFALSLLAVAQRLGGVFQWRDILVQSDGVNYRANATFADPNILARFLASAMALAGGLILVTGPRRLTVYLAAPMLAVSAVAIVATASRSGWLMLLLLVGLVILMAPVPRFTRTRLLVGGALGLIVLLGMLLAFGGGEAARVASLTNTKQILGAREFLIEAGWEMFKDSPFIGLGAGNYQHALLVSYQHILPVWAEVSLSHTSVISILSELGIVGIFLLGFFAIRVAATAVIAYRSTESVFNRLMIAWLGAALVGIFLQSQSEGRLFDDPFLWVLLAIFIAFETSPKLAHSQDSRRPPNSALARGRSTDPTLATGTA